MKKEYTGAVYFSSIETSMCPERALQFLSFASNIKVCNLKASLDSLIGKGLGTVFWIVAECLKKTFSMVLKIRMFKSWKTL